MRVLACDRDGGDERGGCDHGRGGGGGVDAGGFRHGGGMRPFSLVESSGRYLTFSEREVIAILRVQGAGAGRSLARSGGIRRRSRELRGNGGYAMRQARVSGFGCTVEGRR